MSGTLGKRLRFLLKKARDSGTEQTTTLGRGLHIAIRANPDRMRLHRDTNWEPSSEAEHEASVCADQMGWKQYELAWHTGKGGQHYLVLTDTALNLGRESM